MLNWPPVLYPYPALRYLVISLLNLPLALSYKCFSLNEINYGPRKCERIHVIGYFYRFSFHFSFSHLYCIYTVFILCLYCVYTISVCRFR